MVYVSVCNEDLPNFIPINFCIFELTEKRVAAPTVNEKILTVFVKK